MKTNPRVVQNRASRAALLLVSLASAACYVDSITSSSGASGGGGPSAVCQPGASEACYGGPPETLGVGLCKAGVHVCNTSGTAFGPCLDAVEPRPEKCETPEDDDCNGAAEIEFPGCCVPNSIVGCYSGPPSTEWVGICRAGTKVCNELGTAYGPCEGEVLPIEESCETPADDDCDGSINEGVSNCCQPGDVRACYTGAAGTEDVGICTGGTQTCNGDGSGFGPCVGEVTPEAEKCETLSEDESCDGTSTCTGGHLFSKRFGDKFQTASAAVDKAGNIVVIGSFEETTDMGGGILTSAGGSDVYLAKFDPKGAHIFSKRFGNASSQQGNGVTFDKDGNIYVIGSFQGSIDLGGGSLLSAGGDDVFVAKLDSKGKHIWSSRFGGLSSQVGLFIGVDEFDYVTVAGQFAGTVDFGDGAQTSAGGDDIFVLNLDPSGGLLWSKRAGDLGSDSVGGMVVDTTGYVYLTGRFSYTIDFGGGLLTSIGADDIYVAKLDYYGGHLWSERAGDLVGQQGTAIAVGEYGDVYVAGDFQGTADLGGGPLTSAGGTDIYVAMLDSSGGPVWAKRFGDASDQHAAGIAVDASGNVLVTGQLQGSMNFGDGPLTSAGGNDIFVAKLDPSGTSLWSQSFGDSSFTQAGRSITSDASGSVIAAGSFGGTADFGGGLLQCKGTSNAFVLKMEP